MKSPSGSLLLDLRPLKPQASSLKPSSSIRPAEPGPQGRLRLAEDVGPFHGRETPSHPLVGLELGARLILGEHRLLAAREDDGTQQHTGRHPSHAPKYTAHGLRPPMM